MMSRNSFVFFKFDFVDHRLQVTTQVLLIAMQLFIPFFKILLLTNLLCDKDDQEFSGRHYTIRKKSYIIHISS